MFNPNGNKNQESNEEFFMSKLQTFNPSRDIYSANNTAVNPKGNNRRKPNRNDQPPKEKKRVPLLDQPVTDNKSSNKKQNHFSDNVLPIATPFEDMTFMQNSQRKSSNL